MLPSPPLQRSYLQIRSHSEALRGRIPTDEFGGHTQSTILGYRHMSPDEPFVSPAGDERVPDIRIWLIWPQNQDAGEHMCALSEPLGHPGQRRAAAIPRGRKQEGLVRGPTPTHGDSSPAPCSYRRAHVHAHTHTHATTHIAGTCTPPTVILTLLWDVGCDGARSQKKLRQRRYCEKAHCLSNLGPPY